jgi:hypothetical protein
MIKLKTRWLVFKALLSECFSALLQTSRKVRRLLYGRTMKVAVVLGTNHGIQRGENRKDDFNYFLNDLCVKHNIRVIAEEINDDAELVVAKNVCQDLSIDHLIIDPNPTEYKELGIEEYHSIVNDVMNKYDLNVKPSNDSCKAPEALSEFEFRIRNEHHHPRETEWLNRIQQHDNWPVLVICGSNHFDSFCNLLSENDIRVTATESNWGN